MDMITFILIVILVIILLICLERILFKTISQAIRSSQKNYDIVRWSDDPKEFLILQQVEPRRLKVTHIERQEGNDFQETQLKDMLL